MPSVRATTAVSQSEQSGQWRGSQGSFKCDDAHDGDDDACDGDDEVDDGVDDDNLDEWQCEIALEYFKESHCEI